MPTLKLDAKPATRTNSGSLAVSYSLCGAPDPFPAEKVEIRTTADVLAALNDYAKRVEATGSAAYISARIADGQRAPSGFRKLDYRRDLTRAVNV